MPREPRSAAAFDRRLKMAIGFAGILVLAALVVLRGVDLMWRRDRTLAAGEHRARAVALIVAEYLREAFAAADASMRQLAAHSRLVGGPAAPAADWEPILFAARAGLTGIGSLSIVDAEGTIRHSTLPLIVGQSRRGHYVFHRLAEEGAPDGLVADTPFHSVVGSGLIMIPLGRRLTTSDGRFAGIVAATVIPEELRGVFRQLDIGRQGLAWLFHPEGLVLLREPSAADPMGQTAIGNPLFEAARAVAGAGSLRGQVAPGLPPMLSAFDRLSDPPLLLAISLSQDELLADWRREVLVSAAAMCVFALTLGAALVLAGRQIDRRAAVEGALEHAQRLEALGQLTGSVAHDFNNLLTVILGNVALIEGTAAAAGARGELDQIGQAGRRAAELTRGLLAFARRQPLRPQVVDLNEVALGIRPMLATLLGEDVRLELRLAREACPAAVDATQLETALMNLCVNARDAMPRGGLLIIETEETSIDPRSAPLEFDGAPGRYVVIAISDSGVGIPPENLSRVLEPFFTTKAPGRGTGLGLSTVFGFVKQSGGQLRIYSEVGHGTVVKLFFARSTEAAAIQGTGTQPAERGSGQVVLLVEDEEGVRRLATRLLRGLGYEVLAAADGPKALALAHEQRTIDLLFTDVVLPGGMNGREVAEALQREHPGLRVLFASGYPEEMVQHRGQLAPGQRLITKPYQLDRLAEAVGSALRGQPPDLGRSSARADR